MRVNLVLILMFVYATEYGSALVSPGGGVTVTSNVTLNVASLNEAVTLMCTNGGGSNTFQWEKDGTVLDGETGNILTLVSVNASLGGNYTCTVSNIESASITLYVAPYIVTPLDEQILVTAGTMVSITCEADGFPSPAISWFRVDMRDVTIMEASNTSQFNTVVSYSSAGEYRCVAVAEIRGTTFNTTDETTLFVSPAGSVVVIPFGQVVGRQGESIILSCRGQGGPNNSYAWEQNGETLSGRNELQLTLMIINGSSGGLYRCTVSNAAGSDSASTTVNVAPYIVTPLDEQILRMDGTMLSITCEADGFPNPAISWFRVDMHDVTIMEVSNTSQFNTVVSYSSAGVYRCVAVAEIRGMMFNATDETTLFVSPAGSVVVIPSEQVVGRQGESITLSCRGQGGPNNSYAWEQNGEVLSGENENQLTLMIINGSSGGLYRCTVSNAAGSGSASTTLHVAPYIVTPLEEVTLTFNGSSINLLCEADGFPLPTVSWDRNTTVTNVIVSDNSQLILPTVTFGQEGVYCCLANVTINGMEYEDSDYTTIIVSTEGSVMVTPVDQVFTRGENVTLICISMGGPGNVYQWKKDREIVANDSALTLMDIDASSGGSYTCTVSNLAGNDSATTTLYVAPYFVIHPQNVETSNSSEVNITCLAESFPDPEYMWVRDGDSHLVREGVVIADMSNSLGFRPVLFGDEGVYTCVPFITIDLVVHNKSSNPAVLIVSPEGSIQVDPMTFNGNDSGNATFNCMALGGPGNIYSWTKLRNNAVVVNDTKLMLVDIMASDGGVYQCSVENQAGSENATVTLNVSPVVTEHPRDQNVTSFEGTIILSCTATGFPAPTITWFHNNTMEEDNTSDTSEMINNYTTRSTFILSMPATSDSGMYFCRAAINGYDVVDSSRITVLVQDIPEQPRNITAVETQSHYLVLAWLEPHDNNAPILGYYVSYNHSVLVGGERVTLNVPKEMVNVTNLLPGVTYTFTVVAYNDIGNSTESEPTPLSTLEEVEFNRVAAIIGGATGATLGILLLASVGLVVLVIIVVRVKCRQAKAKTSRESQIELNIGSYTVYNPVAEFEQHEKSKDEDQGNTSYYAESVDSSNSEHSDIAGSEVEGEDIVSFSRQQLATQPDDAHPSARHQQT